MDIYNPHIQNNNVYKTIINFDKDKSEEITEYARETVKKMNIIWESYGFTFKDPLENKGIQIFNENDPYGEENWDV